MNGDDKKFLILSSNRDKQILAKTILYAKFVLLNQLSTIVSAMESFEQANDLTLKEADSETYWIVLLKRISYFQQGRFP